MSDNQQSADSDHRHGSPTATGPPTTTGGPTPCWCGRMRALRYGYLRLSQPAIGELVSVIPGPVARRQQRLAW